MSSEHTPRQERYEAEKRQYELEGELETLISRRSLLVRGGAGLAAIGGLGALLGENAAAATPRTLAAAQASRLTPGQIKAKYGSTTYGDSWHSLVLAILADRASGGTVAAKQMGQKYQGISADLDPVKQISTVQNAINAGMKVINTVPLEAANVNPIDAAAKGRALFTTSYNSPAWKTPSEYGKEYVTYFAPDDRNTGRLMARNLAKHLNGKGNIVHLEGLAGATASVLRSAGVDEVLKKEFPGVKLAARINTNWTSTDAQAKMQNLLSSVNQIDGVIGQDDDLGIGAYNAIRIANKTIPVVSNDGTKQALELTRDSFYLGTVNAFSHWIGGYALVRLFDALHGWKPTPAERMMFWQTSWVDKKTAGAYLKAFWGGTNPYDYTKMSRVLHPKDWDTQQALKPMDPNYIWGGEKKPAGYTLPAGYDKKSLAQATALYQAHWKNRKFK